jgi:hypothetical protein
LDWDAIPSLLTLESARAMPLRALLERVDRFTAAHPEFTVAAPHTTLSGLWEVSDDRGTSQWDNGTRMIDDLERRYPS